MELNNVPLIKLLLINKEYYLDLAKDCFPDPYRALLLFKYWIHALDQYAAIITKFQENSDLRKVLRSIANSWAKELDAICLPIVVHSIHSSKLEGVTPEEQYARYFINYETLQQTAAAQNVLKEFPCLQVRA